MDISSNEFFELSKKLSEKDVEIAGLKTKLEETEAALTRKEEECELLKARCLALEKQMGASQLENSLLKTYLCLSWKKIKDFVEHVNLSQLGFLSIFLSKSVPDDVQSETLMSINELMQLPMNPQGGNTIVNGNYNDIHDNKEVNYDRE